LAKTVNSIVVSISISTVTAVAKPVVPTKAATAQVAWNLILLHTN